MINYILKPLQLLPSFCNRAQNTGKANTIFTCGFSVQLDTYSIVINLKDHNEVGLHSNPGAGHLMRFF